MAERKAGKNKIAGKSRRADKGKGWRFSARERRAILFLLPLVAVSVWILWSVARPRYDDSVTLLGDRIVVDGTQENDRRQDNENERNRDTDNEQSRSGRNDRNPDPDNRPQAGRATLSDFDPNTVTYEEMRAMGIATRTAAGIVKYRERGKVFQIPEDFATCYGITDSMYAALKPHIRIGEGYRLERRVANYRTSADKAANGTATAGTAANSITGAAANPGTATASRSDAAATLTPAAANFNIASRKERTELNSADSLELVSVRGIGPRTASDIIAYRERLGGFHSAGQLRELKVMTERNYEAIVEQIWVDSCGIQKIDINFATPNAVSQHPYMSGKNLRRILKNRQLKGGWSTIEDMVDDNTLTPEEAARLAPYLHFTVQPRE